MPPLKSILTLARGTDTAAFERALKKQKKDALFELAGALAAEKRFDAAERVYGFMRRVFPKEPYVFQAWAYDLADQGRSPDAVRLLEEGIKRFPKSPELPEVCAQILAFELDDLAGAVRFFEAALARQDQPEGDLETHFAICLLSQGRTKEGIAQALAGREALVGLEEDDDVLTWLLENALVLYFAGVDPQVTLRTVAELLKSGRRTECDHSKVLLARTKHPEARFLSKLLAVANDKAKLATLESWPAFRRARQAFRWPADLEPPQRLLSLIAAMKDEDSGEFAGTFSLAQDSDATPWTKKHSNDLAVFGADGSGSALAFWVKGTRSLAKAPVVFLAGDDSSETDVLASTLDEFLAILGLCPTSLPYVSERRTEPLFDVEKTFRRWLKAQGIAIPTTAQAEAIVERARAKHKGFRAWLGVK